MTISTETVRFPFVGNGTTVLFPFNATFEDAGDVVAYVDGVPTSVTVTGGSGSTGSVTFATAPITGAKIVLIRVTPKTQLVDYQPNDPFDADVTETALDKLTREVQELKDTVGQTARLHTAGSSLAALTYADTLARANGYLKFNDAGALTIGTGTGGVGDGNDVNSAFEFPETYGALPGVGNANVSRAAMQEAMNAASANRRIFLLRESLYCGHDGRGYKTGDTAPTFGTESAGLLVTSNLFMKGLPGAWIYHNAWGSTGSFFGNHQAGGINNPLSIIENFTADGINVDGQYFPNKFVIPIVSGTVDTFVLDSSASSVDNFYTGIAFQSSNALRFGLKMIASYDGATRSGTLTSFTGAASPYSTPLAAGEYAFIGWNDNAFGFAGALTNVRILNCDIRNFRTNEYVALVAGGKGVNFEQGVVGGLVAGCKFTNCTSAIFVQAYDGLFDAASGFPDGNESTRQSSSIRISDCEFYECGSMLTLLHGSEEAQGTVPEIIEVVMTNCVGRNIGHHGASYSSSIKRKNGILNFGPTENWHITNLSVSNDPGFPGDAAYPSEPWEVDYVGYGLVGPPGAMIWTQARSGYVDGFSLRGDVDDIVRIERLIMFGAAKYPIIATGFRFLNINHFGDVTNYAVRVDPLNIGSGPNGETLRVETANCQGEIEIILDDLLDGASQGICDPNLVNFDNLIIDVTYRPTGKRVRGTAKAIVAWESLSVAAGGTRGFDAFTGGNSDYYNLLPGQGSSYSETFEANGTFYAPTGRGDYTLLLDMVGAGAPGGGGARTTTGQAGSGGGAGGGGGRMRTNIPGSAIGTQVTVLVEGAREGGLGATVVGPGAMNVSETVNGVVPILTRFSTYAGVGSGGAGTGGGQNGDGSFGGGGGSSRGNGTDGTPELGGAGGAAGVAGGGGSDGGTSTSTASSNATAPGGGTGGSASHRTTAAAGIAGFSADSGGGGGGGGGVTAAGAFGNGGSCSSNNGAYGSTLGGGFNPSPIVGDPPLVSGPPGDFGDDGKGFAYLPGLGGGGGAGNTNGDGGKGGDGGWPGGGGGGGGCGLNGNGGNGGQGAGGRIIVYVTFEPTSAGYSLDFSKTTNSFYLALVA